MARELRSPLPPATIKEIQQALQAGQRVLLGDGEAAVGVVTVRDLHVLEALDDAIDTLIAEESLEEGGFTPWDQIRDL